MRNAALVVLATVAAIALSASAPLPPLEQLVEGQVRCGNNKICIGGKGGDGKVPDLEIGSPLLLDKPLYPTTAQGSVLIDGGVGILGNVTINGTLTTTTSTSSGTFSPAVIDAGTVLVRADEQVVGILTVGGTSNIAGLDAGTALFRADVQFAGAVIPTSTTVVGDITLGGQSPSTATATVRSGAKCVCTLVGSSAAVAANGVACSVSSTTLTATSANASSAHVQYICF